MFTFPKHRFDATYIAGAFIAMLIGRILNVYPLSGLLNIGRKNKISGKVQVRLFLLIIQNVFLSFGDFLKNELRKKVKEDLLNIHIFV